tara:strand:+ start:321 stop:623 length:303 start_codon:yes stop_codon:yes gene_type:complete
MNNDMPRAPDRLKIGTLGVGRLRVVTPITVTIDTENDDFIAEAEELAEFGFGKDRAEAIADLQHALVELYYTLEEDQNRLGPDLAQLWDVMQRRVEKVDR